MKIWKYTLRLTDNQVVEMPKGAQILDVQMQNELLQLWALCNEAEPKDFRGIAIYGAGNPMPDSPGKYISTFQMQGGALVFHAFEIIADE